VKSIVDAIGEVRYLEQCAEFSQLYKPTIPPSFLKATAKDMQDSTPVSTYVLNDNKAAIQIAGNTGSVDRLRYLDIGIKYILEQARTRGYRYGYASTVDNRSDIATKAFLPGKFSALRSLLLMPPAAPPPVGLSAPQHGGVSEEHPDSSG